MRPLRFTYLPAEANLTRFASDVTGGTWTLTETTTIDGLAHTFTIRNNSSTDHSGKTALITYVDQDGHIQTSAIALPGANSTRTSTFYGSKILSIEPSETIGTDTMSIGMGDSFIGGVIGLDWRNSYVGYDVIINGSVNYTIQYTSSDIQSLIDRNFDWIDSTDSVVVNATSTQTSNFVQVPIGMRIVVNSQSGNPEIKLNITQMDNGV